jgi:acyl carrier protein
MYRQEDIEKELRTLIAQAMYMKEEEIEGDQLFSDFGLESVTLVKVIQKLCVKHACEINLSELLLHQTLNAASVFICARLNQTSKDAEHAAT